ncbi:DUF4097 family beta strand repeat-containing protein [Clostridium rectalis]|uniref:DUF4097 family beta strand repeat-containing protein n=1 Tax=Clostridium rectalis TaxID=2040295 RepID=UPI000F636BA5|nr:DUF4097 family beta strand repeat-containing protein [Clostridium rectalis]
MRQWKVGSITLGLTLIFLGIIFIIGNIYNFTIIGKLIRLWPLILIGLGIEILICNFYFGKQNEKLKITGSSIFMFLILLFLSATLFVASNIIEFNRDGIKFRDFRNIQYKYTSNFTKNYTVQTKDANKIIVDTRLANIFIDRSPSNNIEVTTQAQLFSNTENFIKDASNSLINITENKTIEIKTNKIYDNSNSDLYNIKLNLYIKIPENIYTEVVNLYGDIEANNLSKGLKVLNKNGSISVSHITGNLTTENHYGKTIIENIKGNVISNSRNGKLVARDITGSFDGSNDYGSMELNNIYGKVDATNANGKITFNNPKVLDKNLTLKSNYGDIKVSLPKEQTGHFQLKTTYGNIKTTLDLPIEKHENKPMQSVDKTIGNNTLPIRIYCDNGHINISSH